MRSAIQESGIEEPVALRQEEEEEKEREHSRGGMAPGERIVEEKVTKVDVDRKKKKELSSSSDREETDNLICLSSPQLPPGTRTTADTSAVATAAAEAVVSRLEQRLLDACRGSRNDRKKQLLSIASCSSRCLGIARPRGVGHSSKRVKASSLADRRRRRKAQPVESQKHLDVSSNNRSGKTKFTSPPVAAG